jgi:hypothetical protein
MVEPDLGGIDDRRKAFDDALVDEPPDTLLAGRLRQADMLRQIGESDATVLAQNGKDFPVEIVQIDCEWRFIHHIRLKPIQY